MEGEGYGRLLEGDWKAIFVAVYEDIDEFYIFPPQKKTSILDHRARHVVDLVHHVTQQLLGKAMEGYREGYGRLLEGYWKAIGRLLEGYGRLFTKKSINSIISIKKGSILDHRARHVVELVRQVVELVRQEVELVRQEVELVRQVVGLVRQVVELPLSWRMRLRDSGLRP